MGIKDIRLRKQITSVKLSANGTEALVVPKNFSNDIEGFLNAYDIPYEKIKDTSGYPEEFLKKGLTKYMERSDTFIQKPHVLITPYSAEDLFLWSLQLFAPMDPEYAKYIDEEQREAEEYYERNRPDLSLEELKRLNPANNKINWHR